MYFDREVITFQQSFTGRDETLRELANRLVAAGVVRDSYPEAILAREAIYPTGLDLGGVGVAIPHTDAEHVITPQLAFMSLSSPVEFYEMGSEDSPIAVAIIIMLALPKAEDQVPMLQKLVGMFEDEQKIARLQAAASTDEVVAVFTEAGIN